MENQSVANTDYMQVHKCLCIFISHIIICWLLSFAFYVHEILWYWLPVATCLCRPCDYALQHTQTK